MLKSIFPIVGPWTARALWQDILPEAEVPQAPLAEEIDFICDQRLAGLLLRYVNATRAGVADAQLMLLRQATFAWSSRATSALVQSRAAIGSLLRNGLDVVVSKGPGIAHLYPSLACRPYSDVDLIVDGRQFDVAAEILASTGWVEDTRNMQPWRYFARHCREGLNLHAADGGSVDLHHTFPPWIWAKHLTPADVHSRARDIEVAGERLRCASAADNLLIAALHVVSDHNAPGRSLIVWRDIVQTAQVAAPGEVAALAKRVGLAGWVKAVLAALPDEVRAASLPVAALAEALSDDPIPHPLRLQAVLSDLAADLGVAATQFARLPLANGVAFLAGMALPSKAFVSAKFPASRHPYRAWWLRDQRGRDRDNEAGRQRV